MSARYSMALCARSPGWREVVPVACELVLSILLLSDDLKSAARLLLLRLAPTGSSSMDSSRDFFCCCCDGSGMTSKGSLSAGSALCEVDLTAARSVFTVRNLARSQTDTTVL